MRETIIELHQEAPAKPLPGQPCNGCGVCCAMETCPVGRLRFRQTHGPCPALTWSGKDRRYHCGLLRTPQAYFRWLPRFAEAPARRLLARWIAADTGCDCDVEAQKA